MTWREEAKELGIPLYDHKLKRVRKKLDVLADIRGKKIDDDILIASIDANIKPENIILEVREANKICRQALIDYITATGLSNVSIEGSIEKLIRNHRLINCKKRGIAFKGTRDDRATEGTDKTETGKSEGTSPDVSGNI